MTSRKFAAIALSLSIAAAFVPSISFAAEDHLEEAIDHAKSATNNGRQGRAEVFLEQTQLAVQHAEAADAEQKNLLVEAAIRDLKNAIELGKAGKVDVAVEKVDVAVGHLSHAK
jgi:hypothetical protein